MVHVEPRVSFTQMFREFSPLLELLLLPPLVEFLCLPVPILTELSGGKRQHMAGLLLEEMLFRGQPRPGPFACCSLAQPGK